MNRIHSITAFLLGAAFASSALAADWQYVQKPQAPQAVQQVAALSAPNAAPYFTITKEDVEARVAEQIALDSAEGKKIQATLDPLPNPVLYSADHPLKVTLQALQINPANKRWQAQAYIISNRATETIRPVSGRYEYLVSVPTVKRQLSANDVIEANDITLRDIPERQLRKDTITDAHSIIGKSPLRMISADRPIRAQEVAMPNLIKKGDMVQMSYTTQGMVIRDQGEALQDGATGAMIRVKNSKSGKPLSARVAGAGMVEVNPERTL